MKFKLIACVLFTGMGLVAKGQEPVKPAEMKPQDTEMWEPVPKTVTPGKSLGDPPSDAIILFNGKNLDQWVSSKDTTSPAKWTVSGGALTVKKGTGNIQTKQSFQDYQLHIEFRIPPTIKGE